MIYDILEAKIAAAGLAVVGVSLFRNTMPADVQIGVMTKSPLNGIPIDPYIEGWYKPHLQLIVRHTDPVLGNALAEAVVKALIVRTPQAHAANAERGRAVISLFLPRELPIQFPRLDSNGMEWSLNFTTAFAFTPSWN